MKVIDRDSQAAGRTPLGRNLTYSLVESLGRAIVIGEYRDRPFPNEAELAEQHLVSRSVTREAVKMLNAKGLLGARPRQGTFVQPESAWHLFDVDVLRWLLDRKSSLELVRQFNELRIAVEPQAAALAARRADAGDIARVGEALERMRRAEQGDENPVEADIAFHVAVLIACGNPFLIQFRTMVPTALRASIRYTNRIAGRTANIEDHAAVHTAIARGRAAEASVAMHGLIDEVLKLIEKMPGE